MSADTTEWSPVTLVDEIELAHRDCVLCAADEDHIAPSN